MERVPEPELMDDFEQAEAYAKADFSEANKLFAGLFERHVAANVEPRTAIDLGCGPGEIGIRLAEEHPQLHIDLVDGSEAMLGFARKRLSDKPDLASRVNVICGYLPGVELPHALYDCIISNSLLHHLHEPGVLWQTVKRLATPGARVLIMDLRRPATKEDASRLVDQYADGEPDVLRRDFFNSLCAAFTPEEVSLQLLQAGLDELEIQVPSDRHMLITGCVP